MTESSTTSLTGHVLPLAPRVEPSPAGASLVAVASLGLALGTMLGGALLAATRTAPAPPRSAPLAAPAALADAPLLATTLFAEPPPEPPAIHARAPRRAPPVVRATHAAAAAADDTSPLRITAPGTVTGYEDGRPVAITVTMVDNKPVERHTAEAFERMQSQARHDGVSVRIVSAFRTMEHQRELFAQYRAGRGNLAAVPGHSNHQSGHALDLNVTAPGVRDWLEAHARAFGFRRTVPSESWHWEHW